MKLQFKALSITLGLVALLGACTSFKSDNPDIAGTENSVEISPDEMELEGAEELEASEELGTEELEASDELQTEELETSEEIEDAELEASEEIEDAENAEIETPELEAVEDAESIDQSSSINGTVDEGVETLENNVDDNNSDF